MELAITYDREAAMGDATSYEKNDHLAILTLNRPEALNAMNAAMRRSGSSAAHCPLRSAMGILRTGDLINAHEAWGSGSLTRLSPPES